MSADYEAMIRRSPSSESGFTLVEVLAAMTLMLAGTVVAMSLIDRANGATRATKAREAATSLTRELTESLRSVPYEALTSSTLLTRLSSQPGLEDSVPGGQYTIVRRDTVFTVTGEVCVMDDPRDGGGSQTGGGFCTGSAPAGSADKVPQDYKRASVTVSWQTGSHARSLTQSAIVNDPGAADAPFIRSIVATNTSTPVTSPTLTSVALQFVASRPTTSLNWSIDGDTQTTAPAPNAARDVWSVNWDISKAVDGSYSVGARAFDSDGLSGSTLDVNLVLNRFAPGAPKDFSGGRNRWGGVELEWAANVERDIIGYEVRRGTTVVCSRAALGLSTECLDTAPPTPVMPKGTVTYTVYAYDRDPSGAVREGPGTDTIVIDYNTAPSGPAQFAAGTGGATVSWNRATDNGPSGDVVAFYRIYKDGSSFASRYARWTDNASGNSTITWTDPRPDGASHTYWVTSVDTNYLESPLVGPVTSR